MREGEKETAREGKEKMEKKRKEHKVDRTHTPIFLFFFSPFSLLSTLLSPKMLAARAARCLLPRSTGAAAASSMACASSVKSLGTNSSANSLSSSISVFRRTFAAAKSAAKPTTSSSSSPSVAFTPRPIHPGLRLTVGVIVERVPIVVNTPEPWEEEWWTWKAKVNERESIKIPDELNNMYKRKADDDNPMYEWEPEPVVTEADKANDRRVMFRKLQEPTYLIIKRKEGKDEWWEFPQGDWMEKETTRQTAERFLKQYTGQEMDTYFLGNAPVCHYTEVPSAEHKQKDPSAEQIRVRRWGHNKRERGGADAYDVLYPPLLSFSHLELLDLLIIYSLCVCAWFRALFVCLFYAHAEILLSLALSERSG